MLRNKFLHYSIKPRSSLILSLYLRPTSHWTAHSNRATPRIQCCAVQIRTWQQRRCAHIARQLRKARGVPTLSRACARALSAHMYRTHSMCGYGWCNGQNKRRDDATAAPRDCRAMAPRGSLRRARPVSAAENVSAVASLSSSSSFPCPARARSSGCCVFLSVVCVCIGSVSVVHVASSSVVPRVHYGGIFAIHPPTPSHRKRAVRGFFARKTSCIERIHIQRQRRHPNCARNRETTRAHTHTNRPALHHTHLNARRDAQSTSEFANSLRPMTTTPTTLRADTRRLLHTHGVHVCSCVWLLL